MRKHFKNLSYLIRHKWHVAMACWRRGLYWRGLVHDWHKILPGEWFPYANFFYAEKDARDKTGYYKPTDTGDSAFDFAWLLHQKRADHHWQWWILAEDEGGVKIFPMSPKARLEMVCDWYGASMAQGNGDWDGVREWWEANNHKMQLHPETREWIASYMASQEEENCTTPSLPEP